MVRVMKKVSVPMPRYVQRLRVREPAREPLVFECDYMGSAEFEFGALPTALRVMREAGDVGIHSIKAIQLQPQIQQQLQFYAVCAAAQTTNIAAWIELDLAEKWHGKESSGLAAALGQKTSLEKSTGWEPVYPGIVGWWAIDAEPTPWVLFLRELHAKAWLEKVQARPESAE